MQKSMTRKCIIPIPEIEASLKPIVLSHLDEDPHSIEISIHDEKIYALSDRYKTFFTRGYTCSHCGITGSYFALERHCNSKRYHLNLYAISPDGEEILMTKDHIQPYAKGGKSTLDNYQTMCHICNVAKGTSFNPIVFAPSSPCMW